MHRSLIAVALLLLAAQVNAQVYKWTDASGTTHYSEAPPAQGIKFSKVTTTGTTQPLEKPATTEAPDPNGAMEPGVQQKPVADTPENRSKLCNSLKANLATLQSKGSVVMQRDGKTIALDSDQRKQQADAAQAQFNQYCKDK